MAEQPPQPPDDEFAPPEDFTPYTQVPAWVTFASLTPQARATCEFLYGHVNPADGSFLVTPSMASIAKYLGVKSENSARKYITELKSAGIVTSVITYWDRKAKVRTKRRIRDDGVKNDQTSNTFQLRWAPPQGQLHPGPMNSDEWHNPGKIERRITRVKAWRAAEQPAPPQHSEGGCDQEKKESSQVAPPLNSGGGPPSTQEGDPPHSVEDEVNQEKETNQPNQDARESTDSVGWLVGSSKQEEDQQPDTDGASLLRRLGVAEHALGTWSPTVDAGLDQWGQQQVEQLLTRGLDGLPNPVGAIIKTRLPNLRSKLAATASSPNASLVEDGWCGECGSHYPDQRAKKNPKFRTVLTADGIEKRCRCHPQHSNQQAAQAA